MEEKGLLLTLFGPPGSGKGTVGPLLAQTFDCAHVDMGDLCRNQAELYGLTLEERHARAEKDPTFDAMLDNRVRELPGEYPRLLIASRTAWFLLPDSIKILLTCRPQVGAERVARRQGISVMEAFEKNEKRMVTDGLRYRTYLGISEYPPQPEVFDIVVDSSELSPDTVLKTLIDAVHSMGNK